MIIKPLARKTDPRKKWAIVYAAGVGGLEMIDCDGTLYRRKRGESARAALREIPGIVFSTVKPHSLLIATDARCWTAKRWQGTLTNLKMDGGPKVIPLRKVFESDATSYQMAESVDRIAEVVNEAGVALGSFSSMAWGLWRSTLEHSVTIHGPDLRDSLYGGRKESLLPGEYREAEYWDISAAYPNAQASEPYPLRLREVTASSSIETGEGIAYAKVRIPRLRWGPLPVNVGKRTVCYGWGDTEGWWPWRDLRVAKEAGADVTILASYAGYHETDLFGAWWREFAPLRQLPGYSGKIAKKLTSTLWGQFALSDAPVETVRWIDEWAKYPIATPEQTRHLPHRWIVHIASETTARVREKLYTEGLSISDSLYCDTDSVITAKGSAIPGHGWTKKKGDISHLDIRGPQVYRYRCSTCGDDHPDWHYVVGGVGSAEGAERVFRREYRRHSLPLSLGYDGMTLPAMPLQRAKELVNGKADRTT